jgi:SAM-dependent methyltransferase
VDTAAERALSFGPVAEAYERARPGYPPEAVAWLVGTEPIRVVDLGAGTGKLTRGLVALGHEVVAVEPSPQMLARLRVVVPAAVAVEGWAEAIPLPDRSAEAVVAGQAFHWFDAPVALREVARVLVPRGRLGLVWNARDDRFGWVARLNELVGGPERFEPGQEPPGLIRASGLFGPVEAAEFAYEQPVDRAGLLELVSTRSYIAVLGPTERDAILAEVGRLYDEVAGPDGVVLPYVTYAYRASARKRSTSAGVRSRTTG